jgi:hypothetical protein
MGGVNQIEAVMSKLQKRPAEFVDARANEDSRVGVKS